MEKKRRAERLIALLRWLVLVLGLAVVADEMPALPFAALIGALALYNLLVSHCTSDPTRFALYGRRLPLATRVIDTAAITYVLAAQGQGSSPVYALYWFVLISCGYSTASTRKLGLLAAGILAAAAAATLYAANGSCQPIAAALPVIALRSGVIIFGFLVAVYIAKTRSQDELAEERGSYLHAILECGVRLTSLRSVHELAVYVLQSAVTQTDAEGGELLLTDDETGELECEAFHAAASHGVSGNAPPDSLIRSYAKWVIGTGREFVVRPGARPEQAEPDPERSTNERDERPAMAVPLLWQSSSADSDSSVLGVLVIWGRPEEDFGPDALDILRIFAAIAAAAIVNLKLYTNLQRSFLRTLQSLANGLDARDEYTRGHSDRVSQVACLIAEELGVPDENIDALRNAAQLHDIGKIGVPDAILRKAGKLTAEEWETMRRHPLVSEEICRPLGLPSEVLFLIKHHHERIDGKGYPSGLSPQEQPLLQRILVVADSFDAMRSRRPYRDRMPEDELIGELNRSAGRTMDPTVVDALRRIMERGQLVPIYEEHDRMIGSAAQTAPNRRAA